MKELKELILENRPHLSEGSVKTYVNCLKNLFSSVFPKTDFNHKLFFADYKKVLEYLNNVKYNVRKTILSALVVISKGEKDKVVEAYRNQMLEDAEKYNTLEKQNKMSDSMKDNWISWDEVLSILNKLKNQVYWIFKEDKPTKEQLLDLQKYVILMCYTQIPPRRSQDFILMKVKNYDEKKDNYYRKGTFHFNNYKTAKFYGLQTVKVPKSLELLLTKWIKMNPKSEYLFFDYYDKALTASQMSKILNSIFKKNISVNILRHSYITAKAGPEIKKLEEIAEDMGHSTNEQKLYVKFN
jgi:hypothetical protein